MSAANINKTIARQKQKVAEGQFYEAHQQLRVIASRHIKTNNPNAAIELLAGGAQLLLNAGQGGSGGDLCLYLMEVYRSAGVRVDAASKGRVLGLLRAFPAGEPTRKRFAGEVVSWSARESDFPAGDPEIHHVCGALLAEDGEVYDAERHFVLGTRDSAPALANLEYAWYATDAPHTAPLYAARAILPYLLVGNLRAANTVLLLFSSRLSGDHPALAAQSVSGASTEARVYPSLPLLNFLTLLLLACQKGAQDLYRGLRTHYRQQIEAAAEGSWDEALDHIGELYFDVKQPRQSNPLMDMMSSMFGGGMGGGGGGGGGGGSSRRGLGEAPAPAPALD